LNGKYKLKVHGKTIIQTSKTLSLSTGKDHHETIEVGFGVDLKLTFQSPTGAPIKNLRVGLNTHDKALANINLRKSRGQTDSNGELILHGISPGNYLIQHGDDSNPKNRYVRATKSMVRELADSGVPISLLSGEDVDRLIVLDDIANIRVLVLSKGKAVANAKVALDPFPEFTPGVAQISYGRHQNTANTDGAGIHKFYTMKPGRYKLAASRTEGSPETIMVIELLSGDQDANIELASGQVLGSVAGSGGLLAGATVILATSSSPETLAKNSKLDFSKFPIRRGRGGRSRGRISSNSSKIGCNSTRTDGSGHFSFTNVDSGWHTVSVTNDAYMTYKSEPFLQDGRSLIELKLIQLEPAATLSGMITRLNTATPNNRWFPPDLILEMKDAKYSTSVTIGDDNNYFKGSLSPGFYRIRMPQEDPPFESEWFKVGLGKNQKDIVLP